MSKTIKQLLFSIIVTMCLIVTLTVCTSDSYAYAETSNESGTAVVIMTDGTVKDYGTDIRAAWHFCDTHKKSTMKLTSDVKLNKNFSTGGKTYKSDIIFDLNGYTIDCQNKTNAFNLFKNGGLKIIDSSSAKTGKIINGNGVYGGAIKTMGSLELDGITIQNCKSTDPLCGGGAIYAWVVDIWIFAINEPHMYINNCTIDGCVGDVGGAIEVHADSVGSSVSSASEFEKTFSNSGTAALASLREQENGINWSSGASIRITNSTISNCRSLTSGGAIDLAGEATLDNTTIKDCHAQYGGGGVDIGAGSTLKMYNSTITGCTVSDGNGGGIYIQYGLGGGETYTPPGHAEIWGGSITNNTAKDGSGIYYPAGHGGSTLKIGGELVVKDNYDKNGKPDNIEKEDLKLRFFDEGLYGNADVGVGTGEKGDEINLGNTVSTEIAKETAAHMRADHKRGTYNVAGQDEKIGIYSKDGDTHVYMGASRKMELIDFQLRDRSDIKVDINREKKEITARFPFSEGMSGSWVERVLVTWDSGEGGTIHMNEGTTGVTQKPYEGAVTTYNKSTFAEDKVVLECNGGMEVWTVRFYNEGETKCHIRVTNGSITGKIPYQESGKTKDYQVGIGNEVELVADDAPSGKCFDYWSYVCRGITPYYEFNDWYNPRTKIVAPASKSKMTGLVFTACYTDIADVTVINGTHTDGTTVKGFEPGKHVKVTADTSLENFDHWEVVSGKLTLTEAQAKSRVLEFNMGYSDPYSSSEGNYGDITVKAVALSVEKPVATPGSGKYTGNQNVKLSCSTENSVIYYSLNGSEYAKYDNPISLTVAEEELQRDYTLTCYSVLTDGKGRELVRSEEVSYKYTIMNPMPKTSCVLRVVNATTVDGKTEDILKPGDKATVVATAPTGKYFKMWKVTEGKLSLTDEELASDTLSFTMPNCDVTIEAVYDGTQILPYKAEAVKGTLNGLSSTYFFEGSTVTAAASPTGGMTFDKWVAKKGLSLSEEQAKSPVFTFTMPANEVELEATFVSTPIDPHTLTVSNGYLETTTGKTSGSYRPDENVAVTAKYSGESNTTTYEFDHWEVVDAPQGFELSEIQKKSESIIITMPNADVELKAVFKEVHYSDNVYIVRGAISGTTDWMKSYNKGDTVKVTASAAGGMTFVKWIAYGVDLSTEQKHTSNEMTFTMPDNPVILIAEYESTPTTVNELITINGCNYAKDGAEGTGQKGTYGTGDPVIARAVNPGTDDEYVFRKWIVVDGPEGFELTNPTNQQIEINMPDGDLVLKAVYAKKYNTKAIHGTISVNDANSVGTSEGTAYEGDTITATADAASSLVFDHWESKGIKLTQAQTYASSFTTTMPSNDIIIEAVYKSGKIEPHKLSLNKGSVVTNQVVPNVKLVSASKIMLSSTSNADYEGTYYAGSKVIIKPYFGTDMVFDHWEADGLELTEEESHQAQLMITMPDNEVSMTAVYREAGVVPYVLTIEGGRITAPSDYTKASDNSAIFYEGCVVEITADNKDGYKFDHWDVEGVTLSPIDKTSKTVTITMPENDAKLVAVYAKLPDVDTADSTGIVLYVSMLLLALAVIGACLIHNRS